MSTIPTAALDSRTVTETIAIDHSDGWWTGLVRDRLHGHTTERLRLERLVHNPGGWQLQHQWRIRPEFWAHERRAVAQFQRTGGDDAPARLPIDDYLTPLEYTQLRRTETGGEIGIVKLSSTYGTRTRLYHWDGDGKTRQRWTVGRHWDRLTRRVARTPEASQ